MHQNQQLIQYDRISSAFFFINRLSLYHHHFNSWPSLIWSDQTGFRQHSFLSSISYRSTFQQLIFSDQTGAPSALFFIKRFSFYQLSPSYHHLFQQLTSLIKRGFVSTFFYHRFHTDQHFNSWPLRKDLVSTHSYHRLIQVKFGPFSAGITLRRQRYMEIFDDFHIKGYFHLFFFMNWILNFISIHPINGMNKWSILIIYSFMK